MTTPEMATDAEWGKLADAEVEERETKITQRFGELVGLSEEERRSQMWPLIRAEYALDDPKLRVFTLSRLRVLIRMDPEAAKGVATTYDRIMAEMPGPDAMRRVAVVQTVYREFKENEQELIVKLIPGVVAGARLGDHVSRLRVSSEQIERVNRPKRRLWPFGKR